MTNPVFFSVVIPTYNRAHLLPKTLDTVMAQTYPHFEVIVVDDNSTDDTAIIIQPYLATGKVHYIRHEQNYERGKARNTGMENANGDFVTFLDSDDLMYPNNLRDASDYIFHHPGHLFFHNRYEVVNSIGKNIYTNKLLPLDKTIQALAEGNFLGCIGVFISREISLHIQFDTSIDLSSAEDYDFWLHVLAKYPLGRIDKINNGAVEHSARSVKAVKIEDTLAKQFKIIHKVEVEPALNVFYPYLKRMKVGAFLYSAYVGVHAKQFAGAANMLWQALKIKPSVIFSYRFLRIALSLFTLGRI